MRVQRGRRERLWGGVSGSGASRRLVSRERFTLSLAPLKMIIIAIIRTSPVKPGAGVPGPDVVVRALWQLFGVGHERRSGALQRDTNKFASQRANKQSTAAGGAGRQGPGRARPTSRVSLAS